MLLARTQNVTDELSLAIVCADVATGETYSLPCKEFNEGRHELLDAVGSPAAIQMAAAVLRSKDREVARAMVELLAEDSARLTALETALKHNGHQLNFRLGEFSLTPATRAITRRFTTLREAIDFVDSPQ